MAKVAGQRLVALAEWSGGVSLGHSCIPKSRSQSFPRPVVRLVGPLSSALLRHT